MPKRKKADPTPEGRMLAKLERMEMLLEDLIILQACQANANRHKIASAIRISTKRVAKISKALKG